MCGWYSGEICRGCWKSEPKITALCSFCYMASISILVSQCCRCTRNVSSHMNMWIYWVIDSVIESDEGLWVRECKQNVCRCCDVPVWAWLVIRVCWGVLLRRRWQAPCRMGNKGISLYFFLFLHSYSNLHLSSFSICQSVHFSCFSSFAAN